MEEQIRKAVGDALESMGTGGVSFMVEQPSEISHGDYATNAALVAAKMLGKKPHDIADELARALVETLGKNIASHVAVAGPGFVNITLTREAITFAVAEADAKSEEWGKGSAKTGQRILIEYTDPNPFKEMHIGHLMSNVIGETLARLIENEGATVIRANYQGDVGPHVAKAIWGLQKAGITEPDDPKKIGEAYTTGSHAYENDPKVKKEIDAINQELYAGPNPELQKLWRDGRGVSLAEFDHLYKILGTHFNYSFYESETAESSVRIVRDGLAKGVFEKGEGDAVIYRGEKKGLHTLVFITGKGTPTYEAKDIGLAFLKEKLIQSDRSIIITAAEQIGHFKVVFAALEDLAPLIAAKTTHVPHGFLRLASGKMSSREGNVITAKKLIWDVIDKTIVKSPDPLIAEQVAVGAIKYMILRQAPGSDVIFDEEKSLSLEGDSGPYLQYALVRARSVLAKARESESQRDMIYHTSPPGSSLLERSIVHFPEVVARAARELAPNLLVNYLTKLAGEWNSFYAQERIISGEHEAHKLLVARAFANTMQNGLTLLGIPAPEKM